MQGFYIVYIVYTDIVYILYHTSHTLSYFARLGSVPSAEADLGPVDSKTALIINYVVIVVAVVVAAVVAAGVVVAVEPTLTT